MGLDTFFFKKNCILVIIPVTGSFSLRGGFRVGAFEEFCVLVIIPMTGSK